MPEFLGTITPSLHLSINKHELIKDSLREFVDKDVVISVELFSRKRTNQQSRWYNGIAIRKFIIPFLQETQGEVYTRDQIHGYHLSAVCGKDFKTAIVLGRPVVLVEDVSTSRMTTIQFNQFKELIQKHWSEKGLEIPDPKENSFLNDYV